MPEHLALVACGAPLAARVHDVAALAVLAGWVVRVVATPSAMNWVNTAHVETITGFPVLVEPPLVVFAVGVWCFYAPEAEAT